MDNAARNYYDGLVDAGDIPDASQALTFSALDSENIAFLHRQRERARRRRRYSNNVNLKDYASSKAWSLAGA